MDIHVELRYDGFNSVQQIGYTSKGSLFLFLYLIPSLMVKAKRGKSMEEVS